MAGPGRPCELTPELIVTAAQLASETCYVETVACLIGVSKDTFYKWLRRGSRERRRRDRGLGHKDSESAFMDFSDAIKKSLAEGEKRHLNNIKVAADGGTWQASAWVLERSHPERWSLGRDELRRLRKRFEELEKKVAGGSANDKD